MSSYLDGAVSVEEANELFDFIRQSPVEARQLMEAAGHTDFSDRFGHLENIDAATSQRMYDRLAGAISSSSFSHRPVHRVHFLRKSWFRYAAAVLLVAGTLAVFLLLNNHQQEPLQAAGKKQPQKDIVPGSDKAVLTLADGSSLVLDEAQNGDLARQGNARVVKLENGRLAYEAKAGPGEKPSFNTLTVPRGGQYALTLADGTRVWLNAASSIRYPTVFAGAERKVEVSGEVYMEIATNSRKPFIVEANGTAVQVLGTSFNLNAYPDESVVRTTLIEGSVRVSKTSTADVAVLNPGQQAEVAGHVDGVKVVAVDTEQVLAWKNGLFSFQNADIKTIMRQLSRWYDINIVYENAVPSQRFFGEMNRNLTLSQVLKGLEVSKVNFRLEGRNLIVMP